MALSKSLPYSNYLQSLAPTIVYTNLKRPQTYTQNYQGRNSLLPYKQWRIIFAAAGAENVKGDPLFPEEAWLLR